MPKIEHLDDLLKIPQSQQTQESLKLLLERRKELADIFYHKTGEKFDTPYDKKMEIFDELEKLHKYFSYKLPKTPFKPGSFGGKQWTTSVEQRKKNCDDVISYLTGIGVWDSLSSFEQGVTIARVWGTVKQ